MGNLNLSQVSASQNNKETTINDATNELDLALTDSLSIDLSAGDGTPTLAEMQAAMLFIGTGHTVARTITVPAVKRLFTVQNDSATAGAGISVVVGATTLHVPIGEFRIFYADGTTDGLFLVGGSPSKKDVEFSFIGGPPTSSQVMMRFVATRDFTFPANFAGAQGYILTNPTASFVINVDVAGSTVGTITISTGGVFTFATTGSVAQQVATGNRVEIVAPAVTDATAADFAATLIADLGLL